MLRLKFLRPIHIAAGVYNILFVYTPLHAWAYGFAIVQYITMPALILTSLLMLQAKRRWRTRAVMA
jgi:hypothetical protein